MIKQLYSWSAINRYMQIFKAWPYNFLYYIGLQVTALKVKVVFIYPNVTFLHQNGLLSYFARETDHRFEQDMILRMLNRNIMENAYFTTTWV